MFCDYNLLVINKKSNENEQMHEVMERLDDIEREKESILRELEQKNNDITKLIEANRRRDLELKERDQNLVEDLKKFVIMIETANPSIFGNFLSFKSNFENIQVLREKIIQLIRENADYKKETKSLAKKQKLLREQIHSLSNKQEEINTNHYHLEEQDNYKLQQLQMELDRQMENYEQIIQNKTDEFEHIMIEKEKEILNYKSMINEHIEIIKRKELEKSEILNFLGSKRESQDDRRNRKQFKKTLRFLRRY